MKDISSRMEFAKKHGHRREQGKSDTGGLRYCAEPADVTMTEAFYVVYAASVCRVTVCRSKNQGHGSAIVGSCA